MILLRYKLKYKICQNKSFEKCFIALLSYFPKYLSNNPFNALPCLASSLAIS